MTGPPEHALEQVPDRAALSEFLTTHEPPFRVGFQQGAELAEAEFVDVQTDRGGDMAELHYADGRYVTVNVGRELEHVEVPK